MEAYGQDMVSVKVPLSVLTKNVALLITLPVHLRSYFLSSAILLPAKL